MGNLRRSCGKEKSMIRRPLRFWTWTALGVLLVIGFLGAGVAVLIYTAGTLERADQLASVVGMSAGVLSVLLGIFTAVVTIRMGRKTCGPEEPRRPTVPRMVNINPGVAQNVEGKHNPTYIRVDRG
jgi:hypothetical protein